METTWYTIFDYPNTIKGSVVVAWRSIPMGTRILVEKPLITIPRFGHDHDDRSEATTPDDTTRRSESSAAPSDDVIQDITAYALAHRADVEAQIAVLGPEQRQILASLPRRRNNFSALVGLVLANTMPAGPDVAGGIFPDACRFNHSCDNNAVRSWNPTIKAYTVHVLTDIDAGEEITITYLKAQDVNSRSRARYLEKWYDFVCRCWLCTMPEADRDRMDCLFDGLGRLTMVGESEEDSVLGATERSQRALRHFREKVRLVEEMGLGDVRLILPFEAAFWAVISHGDVARAHVFADRVAKLMAMRYGIDHPMTAKAERQGNTITRHTEFGWLSMDWKSGLIDIPEGLGEVDFEDWLWRQTTPRKGQLVSLANDGMFFPPFTQLPNKKDRDPVYYFWAGSEKLGRRCHWCFLGEITGSSVHEKEEMVLTEDVDGEEVALAIAWDVELGGGDDTKTIAVLYAEQTWLHPELWGIRVDDPGVFKSFDASLKDLLAASEHAQERPQETDGGVKRCHWCNKKEASLRCEGCPYFWYCDKDCRIDARNEKGHRKHCKILGDTDLQGMLALNWDDYKKEVEFPMRVVEVQEEGEAAER